MIFDGYCIPGTERETRLSIDQLLRQMDVAGIEKAIIAPQDRELTVSNAAGNERILAAATQHADRLVAACAVNPWNGHVAIDEVKRCVDLGSRILVLAPALQGFIPTDELCDDLLASAAELKIPVYFHTGPHSCGSPAQVVLVAERWPATNIVLGHCGSTDHAWDMTTVLTNHRLSNLWFELSFVRPWVVPNYIGLAGADRLIWGSGSPRNDARVELEQLGRFISREQYPEVYGGNLNRLLRLAGI
jgi:predicted TIM-barrel fold metal-dependent hydrolase